MSWLTWRDEQYHDEQYDILLQIAGRIFLPLPHPLWLTGLKAPTNKINIGCRFNGCKFTYEKNVKPCIDLWPSLMVWSFDCPEVTLCGWPDVKIQQITSVFSLQTFICFLYFLFNIGFSDVRLKDYKHSCLHSPLCESFGIVFSPGRLDTHLW